MYELLKTVHLISVILFIGTVFFRTFVILKLERVFTKDEMMKVQSSLGGQARKIIKINNLFLILSGLLLLLLYINGQTATLHIKITLGLILVVAFYFVPLLFTKMDANRKFKTIFHYTYFSLLILVVILSQFIYSF